MSQITLAPSDFAQAVASRESRGNTTALAVNRYRQIAEFETEYDVPFSWATLASPGEPVELSPDMLLHAERVLACSGDVPSLCALSLNVLQATPQDREKIGSELGVTQISVYKWSIGVRVPAREHVVFLLSRARHFVAQKTE